MMTEDDVQTAKANYRMKPLLHHVVECVHGMEAFLERTPVERRPPDWEARVAAVMVHRDALQIQKGRLY